MREGGIHLLDRGLGRLMAERADTLGEVRDPNGAGAHVHPTPISAQVERHAEVLGRRDHDRPGVGGRGGALVAVVLEHRPGVQRRVEGRASRLFATLAFLAVQQTLARLQSRHGPQLVGDFVPQLAPFLTAFLLQGNTPAEEVLNTGSSWKTVRDTSYRPLPVKVPGYGRLNAREIRKEDLVQIWEDVQAQTGLKVNTEETVLAVTPTPDNSAATRGALPSHARRTRGNSS